MLHPTGQQLVDRLYQSVQVNGRCIVAVRTSKYGGAILANGTITKIVPLVEALGVWHSTGPNARIPFWREDQLSKSHRTEYYPPLDRHGGVFMPHAYVASVLVDDEKRARTVPFGSNLITF